MPTITLGNIDVACDPGLDVRAYLRSKPTLHDLAARLILANAHSNYIESRLRAFDSRGDFILSDEIEDELPEYSTWVADAPSAFRRPRLFTPAFMQRFGAEQFYFNIKMLLAREEGEAFFVATNERRRWRYDYLATTGVVRRGAAISIRERLDVMPAPILKALGKGRGAAGKSKTIVADKLDADPDFRRVFDANSNSFFLIDPLGFDEDRFLAEYGIWAVFAAVLLHPDKIDSESASR